MKFGYYPGCSLLSSAKEYADSAEAVLEALGVELQELDDWVCCGATPAHATSHLLSLALPAISCAAAERDGLDVLTCCSACYSRLKQANHELRADPELLAKTNEIIEENYRAEPRIWHLAELFAQQFTPAQLKAAVTRPLTGLRIAVYYGCLLVRMPEELRIDSAEYPTIIDNLMTQMGAESVDWPGKTECCGAAMTLARPKTVVRLSAQLLHQAKAAGADVLAVACPLCQANLDMFQSDTEHRLDEQFGLPVLYFTQLMGLAMGLPSTRLGLNKLIVDAVPVLADKDLIAEPVFL